MVSAVDAIAALDELVALVVIGADGPARKLMTGRSMPPAAIRERLNVVTPGGGRKPATIPLAVCQELPTKSWLVEVLVAGSPSTGGTVVRARWTPADQTLDVLGVTPGSSMASSNRSGLTRDQVLTTLRQVVTDLSDASRPSTLVDAVAMADARAAVNDYDGGQLLALPDDEADYLIQVCEEMAVPEWYVEVSLWTELDGRSDLELRLRLASKNGQPLVTDLHVLAG